MRILKGGDGYIQRGQLKSYITVYVKTFHGDRKNHEFKVSILDRVYTIYERLYKIDRVAMKQYFEKALIYPMGCLRRVDAYMNDTFFDLQIPDGARLVLVGKHSFTWDPNTKGRSLRLSGGNLTVRKASMEVDYDGCFGSFPLKEDTHYWEIKILNFYDLNDIMIGVSSRN